MATYKTVTNDAIRELSLLEGDSLTEALLDIIRRGPRGFMRLYEALGGTGSGHAVRFPPEVRESIVEAIRGSAFRCLEGAIEYVKQGPELHAFMGLLDVDAVTACLLRYGRTGQNHKVLLCGDWLAGKNAVTPGVSADGDAVFLVLARAWLAFPPGNPVFAGLAHLDTDGIESGLVVMGKGNDEARELLAYLYCVSGRMGDFLPAVCGLIARNPNLAQGRLGVCLTDAVLAGESRGIDLPDLPPRALEAVRGYALERTTLNINAQHRSLAHIINGLLKYADCIQEWNEWTLQGFGMGSDVIAEKILEEAKEGHRESVSLTRHIQTLEEAELEPGDPYPVLLETMIFSADAEGLGIARELTRNLPDVLMDERMFKLAVTETFAFLGALSEKPDSIKAVAGIVSNGSVNFRLEVSYPRDAGGIEERYANSLAWATADRVMRVHSGKLSTQVNDGVFSIGFNLPAHTCSLSVHEPDGGDVPLPWDRRILDWVKERESDLTSEITQILAILVHDMKNAFSFIQNWAEGLRSGERECARSVTRIRENINRLRESAKEAEAVLTLDETPVVSYEDSALLTEEVLASLQASADAMGVVLVREYAADLPRIPVDKGRYRSLVANLVKNGLEATVPGGQVRVATGFGSDNSFFRLEVEDSGGTRLHDTTPLPDRAQPIKTGTGVGLLAARRIVGSHNGELTLRKVDGLGVRVTVDLPMGDEERLLTRYFPFRGDLGDECVKGLRAGLHMWRSGDSDNAMWLFSKGIELEVRRKLAPCLQGWLLMPDVLKWLAEARKARTIGPGLSARLGEWAEANSLDDAARVDLERAVANVLWLVGKGAWDACKASMEELAGAVLLFGTGSDVDSRSGQLKGKARTPLVKGLLTKKGISSPVGMLELASLILAETHAL